jgi:hypothetical protein
MKVTRRIAARDNDIELVNVNNRIRDDALGAWRRDRKTEYSSKVKQMHHVKTNEVRTVLHAAERGARGGAAGSWRLAAQRVAKSKHWKHKWLKLQEKHDAQKVKAIADIEKARYTCGCARGAGSARACCVDLQGEG